MPGRKFSQLLTAATLGIALTVAPVAMTSAANAAPAAATAAARIGTVYPSGGPYVWAVSFQADGAKETVAINYSGSKIGGKPDIVITPNIVTVSHDKALLLHSVFGKAGGGTGYDTPAELQAAWTKTLKVSDAAASAAQAKPKRIAAVKKDTLVNGERAFNYVSGYAARKGGTSYIHAHKAAIAKAVAKRFTHSKLYRGSVKFNYVRENLVNYGDGVKEWYIRYAVTVRDTTDKVAYRIELNTHDGGAYGDGVQKIKY